MRRTQMRQNQQLSQALIHRLTPMHPPVKPAGKASTTHMYTSKTYLTWPDLTVGRDVISPPTPPPPPTPPRATWQGKQQHVQQRTWSQNAETWKNCSPPRGGGPKKYPQGQPGLSVHHQVITSSCDHDSLMCLFCYCNRLVLRTSASVESVSTNPREHRK